MLSGELDGSPHSSNIADSSMIVLSLNELSEASAIDVCVPLLVAIQHHDTPTVEDTQMSLFGLDLTANCVASTTEVSTNPSVTLTPSQFEDAISRIATRYM